MAETNATNNEGGRIAEIEAVASDPLHARVRAQKAWHFDQQDGRATQGELRAFTAGWRACFDEVIPGTLIHQIRQLESSEADLLKVLQEVKQGAEYPDELGDIIDAAISKALSQGEGK